MSDRGRHWLRQELPLWQQEGLIDAAQAKALARRYRLDELGEGGFWRHLISAAGAILIGLGVILLFAYNWEAMGRYWKLTVIFLALLLAHGGGLLLLERNRLLSEGLFAIGSMLMGAGIFLVGQIYHLQSHYPDALLLWSLGVLALAWALPSRIQAWMALILILVWHFSELVDFNLPNEWVLLPLGLLLPLVWRLDSPLLARFYSATLLAAISGILVIRENEAALSILLSVALILVALPSLAEALGRQNRRELAEALAAPALATLVLFLLSVSIREIGRDLLMLVAGGGIDNPLFWISLVLSQGLLLLLLLWKRRLEPSLWLAEAVLLLVILPQLLVAWNPDSDSGWISAGQSLLVNLLTLGLSLWMMISGAREVKRRRLVWGALLFAVLVVLRYLDLFDSLIARGLVFLLAGVGLFALSHWYRRNRREAEA